MRDTELIAAAHARENPVPISTVMHLASQGPVLGAGTLVLAVDAARRLSSLRGQEARVLALLSAAYNRAVPPSVLGNIERAAKSWREGDDSLAYIHLAHAGLPELQDPRAAARRLCLADGLMKAGGKPRAIFEILDIASEIVIWAFILVFGAVCLALALAFGLGGREVAGRYLERWLENKGDKEITPP